MGREHSQPPRPSSGNDPAAARGALRRRSAVAVNKPEVGVAGHWQPAIPGETGALPEGPSASRMTDEEDSGVGWNMAEVGQSGAYHPQAPANFSVARRRPTKISGC